MMGQDVVPFVECTWQDSLNTPNLDTTNRWCWMPVSGTFFIFFCSGAIPVTYRLGFRGWLSVFYILFCCFAPLHKSTLSVKVHLYASPLIFFLVYSLLVILPLDISCVSDTRDECARVSSLVCHPPDDYRLGAPPFPSRSVKNRK